MKNLKLRKILLTICCAMLLVTLSVGATFAYLTSQDTVTNTFTVGNVLITLDEAKVTTAGVKDGDTRVDANTYHLIPGHNYVKDPTVHVDADSENCWVFVKLENGIKAIVDATTIEDQIVANNWTLIDATENIYAYNNIVSGGADVVVFGEFTLKGDADVANYKEAKVVVTAYAVQADGFDTAEDAWDATFAN